MLEGRAGNDRLIGGSGSDTFVFGLATSGSDAIQDFDAATDKLSFYHVLDSDGDSDIDFEDLEAMVSAVTGNGNTVAASPPWIPR